MQRGWDGFMQEMASELGMEVEKALEACKVEQQGGQDCKLARSGNSEHWKGDLCYREWTVDLLSKTGELILSRRGKLECF